MRKYAVLFVLLMSCSLCFTFNFARADQPESSYWYPEELLRWSPESDEDAIYNRSVIPLAERTEGRGESDARLVALSAMNPTTSGVPSQGGDFFYANTFSYWQYVDLMVYWAGSAGEGIITPPSADVIDNAHRNGVPILGNVFFPPKVYGGKDEWVDHMLAQNEDGSFPAADQLLKVAGYYGFDGWFINQETEGGSAEDAELMQEFLIYLQNEKPEHMEIMWYDSMTEDGRISWQNYLTDKNKMFLQDGPVKVADSMFLNFWWSRQSQQQSAEKAWEIGRSPYDLFAGIDVEANGYQTAINWDNVFPEGQEALTSLGIYRPDWAYKDSKTMEEFYQKEQHFWTGAAGNPEKTESNPASWKGMAHYFDEKTVIDSMPFITHFNTGSGQFFHVDGDKKSEREWNNRSVQDILPTWRWKTDNDLLSLDFTWDEAYTGGSSVAVTGDVSKGKTSRVDLYKTNVEVEKHTQLALTYKSLSDEKVSMAVSFSDHPDEYKTFDLKKKSHGKWVTDHVPLKKFEGKTITSIGIEVKGKKKPVELYLGGLSLMNKSDMREKAEAPVSADIIQTEFDKGIYADVRVSWAQVNGAEKYEIYRLLPDGQRELSGVSVNNAFYLNKMKRAGKEEMTTFEVVTVNKAGNRSKESAVMTLEWPPYPSPEADFTSDQTVAAPGQKIQFTSLSSEVTEELQWTFEGAVIETSTDAAPSVSYLAEGVYTVKLTAVNSEGKDTIIKENYITISEGAADIRNLAAGSTATASGQCAQSEGPSYAIDGSLINNSKWCAIGDGNWLQLDLGDFYQLAEFKVYHAEAGGEPAAFNTKIYRIETSLDGENWREAVYEDQNTMGISSHAIPLTEARYVRLNIVQPTQGADKAARIFEFEVFGF